MSVGPSLNDDSQGNAQFDSRGEGLQAFIDDSDLLIKSSQDVIYNSSTCIYIYIYIYMYIHICSSSSSSSSGGGSSSVVTVVFM